MKKVDCDRGSVIKIDSMRDVNCNGALLYGRKCRLCNG